MLKPSTDEEISIVNSTLFELRKAWFIIIKLLPENVVSSRPVRSVKPVSYKEMEEE